MAIAPEPISTAAEKNAWHGIYALSLVAFAMTTAEVLPMSMLPLLATGLDASEGLVGQAITATAIAAIIFSLSIGRIVGHRDRRLVMIVFTAALVVSNVGVALSPNVWTMLLSRMILGATIGINWGLMPSVGLRIGPPGHVARGLSIVVAGASLSGLVSAPLASLLGNLLSWRVVYLAATAIAALAVLGLIRYLPSMPPQEATRKVHIGETLRLPGLLAGMLGMMLAFGGSQTFYTYLVPYLEDVAHVEGGMISVILLVAGIAGLTGNFWAAKPLQKNLSRTFTMAVSMLAVTLACLLIFGKSFIICLPLIAAWAFFRNIVGVGGNAWVAQTFPHHAEGAGGLLVTFIQGSMMLGAMLGGILIDSVGPKGPPTAGLIILTFGAVYLSSALRPRSDLALT
ncbi:MAG: MFS transporter [Thermomicrobiales bacterium]|nr:MFS transporter [Thermomicrobiales bacterium]